MSELLLHHIYIKSTASPRKGHGEPAQDELNRTQKTKEEQQRKASVGLFSSFQLLSRVRLFVTPWTAARQASLSITNSQSPPKPISIESVMSSTVSSSVIPLSSCPQSCPASGSFKWVSSSNQVAKVLEFQLQHQSFQWTHKTDIL